MQNCLIAITGASGFVGAHLYRQLQALGLPVVGITRDGAGSTRAVGDIANAPDWHGCLEGVGTVVHCAAVAHRRLGNSEAERERVYKVNYQAVERLGKACIAAGVKRLLFASSIKVYGESTIGRPPFSESDELKPEDDYGISKAKAEIALKGLADHGLEVCCLRLPLLYGPDAKANFRRLQKLAISGIPLPLGCVNNRRSVLGLNNLGQAVVALMACEAWPYAELNVADPEPVSVPDLVRWLALAHGTRARLLPVPVSLLKAMAVLLSKQEMFARIAGSLEISTTRLHDVIPAVVFTSTEQAIQQLYGTERGTVKAAPGN